ncbi:hypothetical protein IM538_16355 [Cytobacillus suaedae]|nr:hypothetical protein IM538_16355 [Cytobacillus suaedae]
MNKRDSFLRIYHYTMETYLLYIFLFVFTIFSNTIQPIVPFLVLLGIGGCLVFFIFLKLKAQSNLTFLISAIIIILIGYILKIPFGPLLFMAGFMLWRIPTLVNEADRQNEAKVIGVVFCLGVVLYIMASLTEYPHKNLILILVAFHFMLLIVGRFMKTLLVSSFSNEDTRKKQTTWLVKMLGIALGGIAILTVALPGIKWSFFFLLKSIFILLSIPFMPLLYWLLSLEFFQDAYNKVNQTPVGEEDPVLQELMEDLGNREPLDLSTLWAFITVTIAAIAFYLIWKKYRNLVKRENPGDESLIIRTTVTDLMKPGQSNFKRKQKPPKDLVRKLFYELEKVGAKKKKGRENSETVEQWFDRVHLNEYTEVIKDYEKVRYAEASLSKEEQDRYTQLITELKHRMIEMDNKQEDV